MNVLIPLQDRNIEEETKWMKYVGLAHSQKPRSIGGMTNGTHGMLPSTRILKSAKF